MMINANLQKIFLPSKFNHNFLRNEALMDELRVILDQVGDRLNALLQIGNAQLLF